MNTLPFPMTAQTGPADPAVEAAVLALALDAKGRDLVAEIRGELDKVERFIRDPGHGLALRINVADRTRLRALLKWAESALTDPAAVYIGRRPAARRRRRWRNVSPRLCPLSQRAS